MKFRAVAMSEVEFDRWVAKMRQSSRQLNSCPKFLNGLTT